MATTLSDRQQALVDKAARLIRDGHVTRLHDRIYRVQGDTGTYLVVLADHGTDAPVPDGACWCPAAGECSHLLAVRAIHRTYEELARHA